MLSNFIAIGGQPIDQNADRGSFFERLWARIWAHKPMAAMCCLILAIGSMVTLIVVGLIPLYLPTKQISSYDNITPATYDLVYGTNTNVDQPLSVADKQALADNMMKALDIQGVTVTYGELLPHSTVTSKRKRQVLRGNNVVCQNDPGTTGNILTMSLSVTYPSHCPVDCQKKYNNNIARRLNTTNTKFNFVVTFTGYPPMNLNMSLCGTQRIRQDTITTAQPDTPVAVSSQPAMCSCQGQLPSTLTLNNVQFDPTTAMYQWQSSTAGQNNWINIGTPSKTSSLILNAQNYPTDYRCQILFQNSVSANLISTIITIKNTYCPPIPTNCASGNNINHFILSGEFTSQINDANTNCASNAYNDETKQTIILYASQTYQGQISTQSTNNMYYAIWIDLNNNYIFEDSEKLTGGKLDGSTLTNFNLIIPSVSASVILGTHRMRVTVVPENTPAACGGTGVNGETHDYTVNLVATWTGTPTPPTAITQQPSTCSCRNQLPFTLSLSNANFDPTNAMYLWQSSPTGTNTWSNLAGPVSSSTYQGAGQDSPSDYQCLILVQNPTPTIITSMIVTISNSYCPTFAMNCNQNAKIDNFILPGDFGSVINDQATGCSTNGYKAPIPTTLMLTVDKNYMTQVSTGGDSTGIFITIWIDLNNNFLFENSEIISSTSLSGVSPGPITVNVPSSMVMGQFGQHRMRVMLTTINPTTSCGQLNGIGETQDYNIQIVMAWTGTPTQPTAITQQSSTCSCRNQIPFILSLSNTNFDLTNAMYLWQSSPTGTNTWSNLGAPTGLSTYEGAGQDSPSDYQCLILIQNPTPMIITSAIVTISNSYCPTFAMNCNQNNKIDNFILAGDFGSIINDQTTGCSTNGYKAPNPTTLVLIVDKNYAAQVSTGGDSTGMFITIWIDINNNFVFENSEIISSTSLSGVSPGPITVNVPSSMVMINQYGRHRMRVMLTTINPTTSCGQLNGIGETHDYNIQIVMAWPGTPAQPTTTTDQSATCSCNGKRPFTLSLSNVNFDPTNAIYLWQSAPTGTNTWNNLGAPTVLPTYQGAGQDSPSDYQCQILIQNPTPMIIYSKLISISNTYCPPLNSICDSAAGYDMIDTFTIVGVADTQINDVGTGCSANGYDKRLTEEVVLRINSQYSISLSTGYTAKSATDRDFFAIWIDFNNDSIFTGQEIVASGSFADTTLTTFTLTIPSLSSTVQLGRFRMRVSVARGGLPNGCQISVKFGETQDYMVQVTDGWFLLPNMNHARSGHTASVLKSGNLLVIGGYDGTSVLNTAESFDMSTDKKWKNTASMQDARTNHTATVLSDGQVLVIGGSQSGLILMSVELYNPKGDQWTTRSPMTAPRTMHTASLLSGDKILVTGGMSNGVFINTAALYDVKTDTWTAANDMISKRLQHTASTLSSNKVLLAGGDTPDTSGTSELYQGANAKAGSVSNMAYARQWHRASAFSTDQVLVTGGRVDSTSLYPPAAELYTPKTKKWSTVAAMTSARMSHTATVLLDNIVVAAGGELSGIVLSTAEYYDMTKKTWNSAGHLIYARSKHADLVFNGEIVIVTGGSNGANSLQTVELWYDVLLLAP
ncbi:unnamed protein product [Adineta steineri]|uniref:GEVED domain-containing protein n=1 Tax=Adineta steineri TaxID=433720 RepID=A0A819Q3B2_9BILA|nr:unnamed protein product [Adineta steineri]